MGIIPIKGRTKILSGKLRGIILQRPSSLLIITVIIICCHEKYLLSIYSEFCTVLDTI